MRMKRWVAAIGCALAPSPVPGLNEIDTDDRQIFYLGEDVNFIVSGNIIDARTLANLTQERLQGISAIDAADLPLSLAMKRVKGNGRRIALTTPPIRTLLVGGVADNTSTFTARQARRTWGRVWAKARSKCASLSYQVALFVNPKEKADNAQLRPTNTALYR